MRSVCAVGVWSMCAVGVCGLEMLCDHPNLTFQHSCSLITPTRLSIHTAAHTHTASLTYTISYTHHTTHMTPHPSSSRCRSVTSPPRQTCHALAGSCALCRIASHRYMLPTYAGSHTSMMLPPIHAWMMLPPMHTSMMLPPISCGPITRSPRTTSFRLHCCDHYPVTYAS